MRAGEPGSVQDPPPQPSGQRRNFDMAMSPQQHEDNFEEIALVELSLEKARARAERAAKALRDRGAEPHLVEALESTQQELSEAARQLRQRTYFAVPEAQAKIQAA
jgi:hypothetical protein